MVDQHIDAALKQNGAGDDSPPAHQHPKLVPACKTYARPPALLLTVLGTSKTASHAGPSMQNIPCTGDQQSWIFQQGSQNFALELQRLCNNE